jgi:nucleotide-binding universal stress UspA family protein
VGFLRYQWRHFVQRFRHILGILDPRQPAETLLERAVELAQTNQAKLTVVHVVPELAAGTARSEGGAVSSELQDAAIADARERLDKAIADFRAQIDIDADVLVGTPFLVIIREVLRNAHDLVIKAPENPDWLDRLLGSDDMQLLRKCPCPVWLVKQAPTKSYHRILAAVDVDTDHPGPELAIRHRLNVQILELAVSLALSDFTELHVVHAWEALAEAALSSEFLGMPDAEVAAYVQQVRRQHKASLCDLINEVMERQGSDAIQFLKPKKHLIKGLPRKEIPALAKSLGADLLVMGTVARTGVPGFLIGNTAEAILEQAECSVLAVKPEGFVTTVTLE